MIKAKKEQTQVKFPKVKRNIKKNDQAEVKESRLINKF